MKLFGVTFTFNGFNVFHEGNYSPPTKLSDFENDIGAGGGLNIVMSPTEPEDLVAGDFWFEEI